MSRQGVRLLEYFKPPTGVSFYSDFAAQVESRRNVTATCASKENFNCRNVSVAGFNVTDVPAMKKGRQVGMTRQRNVVVAFAFFDCACKADARSLNILNDDFENILLRGTPLYGEWFLNRERLPGGLKRGDVPANSGLKDKEHVEPL